MRRVIFVVGTSYKVSSFPLRERLSFDMKNIGVPLKKLYAKKNVDEVMILSTCNRTEIIGAAENPCACVGDILNFVQEFKGIKKEEITPFICTKLDEEAIRHVFRVASSLDSLVVGEPQILGQMKEAYRCSVEFSTSGASLNRLMRRAFSVARRVRRETRLGEKPVSISYAAVIKMREFFGGSIEGKRAMVVGGGEMARLSLKYLLSEQANVMYIADRTLEKAKEIAFNCGARAISLDEIGKFIGDVDMVVTSTASPLPVIFRKDVEKRRKDLLIMDIAVPRDVEDDVADVPGVFVYNIDELKGIVDEAIKFRKADAEKAEKIIEEEVENYIRYTESLDFELVVARLRKRIDVLKNRELEKLYKKLGNRVEDGDRMLIEAMVNSVLNKLLHEPTQNIRGFLNHPEGDLYIEAIKRIFSLEDAGASMHCFFAETADVKK
ncbi:MAG: glutamyl-tRNA reductase [Deltaproteobacteria bacterium]|nr:glutamyl-tRNA reductase [Deltaproteobacteria bacterium]